MAGKEEKLHDLQAAAQKTKASADAAARRKAGERAEKQAAAGTEKACKKPEHFAVYHVLRYRDPLKKDCCADAGPFALKDGRSRDMMFMIHTNVRKGNLMNAENLHELIDRYENGLPHTFGAPHEEFFKWSAIQCWQQEWNKPAGAFRTVADRFAAATKEFGPFIDNSREHPRTGIIKMSQKDPDQVTALFMDTLFAADGGDAARLQYNMDAFVDGMEALRQKYFPRDWSYKVNRHAASVFMAVNAPEKCYVYKSKEATTMAKYIGFGLDIGVGRSFKLENYYRLCDTIVKALQEHPSLIQKVSDLLPASCYDDKSLHTMAFDFMYCCRAYRYYNGLTVPSTGKTIKKKAVKRPTPEQTAEKELERQQRIRQIDDEILGWEQRCDGVEDISLLGVTVSSAQYGDGAVMEQDVNRIKVKFAETVKVFVLDKRYPVRPRFTDDDEIVNAFTIYADALEHIKALQKERDGLEKEHRDAI